MSNTSINERVEWMPQGDKKGCLEGGLVIIRLGTKCRLQTHMRCVCVCTCACWKGTMTLVLVVH